MIKHPIYYEFNLDATTGHSKIIALTHTDDDSVDVIELAVTQYGQKIDMTGTTATARMVLHGAEDYLLSDDVSCEITDSGNILIPFDNAVINSQKGIIKIEVNIIGENEELTLQLPLWVKINDSILEGTEVIPETEGKIRDLIDDARAAVDGKADRSEIPTRTSQLTNDSGFLTHHQDISGKADKLPVGTSGEIVNANGNGEIQRSGYRISTNKDFIADRDSANSVVPNARAVAQYVEGKGYLTQHQDISGKADAATTLAGYGITDGLKVQSVSNIDACTERNVLYRVITRDDEYYIINVIVEYGVWSQFRFKDSQISTRRRTWNASVTPGEWNAFDSFYNLEDSYNKVTSIPTSPVPGTYPTTGAVKSFVEGKGYLTQHQDISGKANIADIPTKTSDLTNDSGFITDANVPTASVSQTAEGATITVTDKNGTTTANISNGNDYVLTVQDKSDIADIVLSELPTTQGVLYGNTSN